MSFVLDSQCGLVILGHLYFPKHERNQLELSTCNVPLLNNGRPKVYDPLIDCSNIPQP